ncbi:C2H2 finger domain transcription factor mtfA [Lasiodiplodia hormozganensis]|uniref:C2H2 finger domain transcription factor mtfA n=2 Tax=Lasiodiplodia TaxID=66739 RepID=A0A5N5DCX9_9PEZI|nr:C2H2 finger domain transcription factor mtfA [Lasiodiplodia theobromae]KAK0638299.1 C2H2 finger domain transcription factor mtfA [Lasiodiplodia hormozganensis]
MVHGTGRDSRQEAHEYYRQQHQHHLYQSQQRVQHHPQDVAAGYHHQLYQQQQAFKHAHPYPGAPQSPPSPPVEDLANKPSLPSISSLLGIADGERPSQEPGEFPHRRPPAIPHTQHDASREHRPPRSAEREAREINAPPGSQSQQASPSQQPQTAVPQAQQPQQQQPPHQQQVQHQPVLPPDHRPDQAQQAFAPTIVSHPRMTLPPTPPMRPDSVIDGNQSPSTSSQSSVPQQTPYYLGQSLNNMEPHQQRQQMPPAAPMRQRPSVPSQPATSPYATSPYAPSPYASSPGAASVGSYYSPENQVYTSPGMYGQRPLPSNFPPPPVPVSVPVTTPGNPNPWQHHHYISASSAAAFPQSQDRYICQTCNKAFSRPSSLRIHSHSHTGEKPFKCPHAGCGKAFSVRSNMKRHERGCHATAGPSVHGS